MAEQRVNGLGQTVEFNEGSGRWNKVVEKEADAPVEETQDDETETGVTTEEAGTGDPAPGENETMVDEGAAPQRRVRFSRD